MEKKNDGNHMDNNPTERFFVGMCSGCPHSSCNRQLKEGLDSSGRTFLESVEPSLKHSHVFFGEKKSTDLCAWIKGSLQREKDVVSKLLRNSGRGFGLLEWWWWCWGGSHKLGREWREGRTCSFNYL